jgi:hypothetical protein
LGFGVRLVLDYWAAPVGFLVMDGWRVPLAALTGGQDLSPVLKVALNTRC